jgi:hypothetical protein
MASKTIEQKSNAMGFPKPGEMIDMMGTHALSACDRAIVNILYRHAHDSTRIGDPGAKWEIPLAEIRETYSKHESKDRLIDCLKRIKSVVVSIGYVDEAGEVPEPRVILTGLFDFFDISVRDLKTRATLRYSLPPQLVPIIARSGHWGRIKAEVVCAMTSKYAMALYEHVQLRANLDRCVDTFAIDRFRKMLGVPPGAYERGNNFKQFVIDPAVLEVNGLSDMSVTIALERRHPRAPVHAVTMAWWRKSGEEFREAMQERNRSKVGRMARLKGKVERVETVGRLAAE